MAWRPRLGGHAITEVIAKCVSPVVLTSSTSVARHASSRSSHPVETVTSPWGPQMYGQAPYVVVNTPTFQKVQPYCIRTVPAGEPAGSSPMHSLFAPFPPVNRRALLQCTRCSLLAVRYSLFATRCSISALTACRNHCGVEVAPERPTVDAPSNQESWSSWMSSMK
jgi:hypothetical protein